MEKFFRSNKFVMVVAVFIAVILWLFVTGDKIARTTPQREIWRDVPLQVKNLSEDYVVVEIIDTVDVTLEGLADDFEGLTMQEIEVYVDLDDKGSGNHLARVHGNVPSGLSIVMIEPEQVRVALEAYYSDDFEIEVNVVGEPAEGWELDEYTPIPEEVLIGAPESIFEQIDRVVTLVDISGMRLIESVELSPVAYDIDGNRVNELVMDPSLVIIRLEFSRVAETESDSDSEENGQVTEGSEEQSNSDQ
ncbi:MAG: CdaR family protein [Bacillota bacterium]